MKFADWVKHVNWVIEERGRWVGVGDGDGKPLWSLPGPVVEALPDQWSAAEDLEVTVPATLAGGEVAPWTQALVIGGLGGFDESGKAHAVADVDYTLLVCEPGPDGSTVRRGGVVTHVEAVDANNDGVPETVTIKALSFADVWATTPTQSWDASWWKARPYEVKGDEAGVPYPESWLLAKVEFATNAQLTLRRGRAGFVIRRLAQESLDHAMVTQRDPDGLWWVDDPFHVVEVPEVDRSPEISLTVRDGSLLETVSAQAKNAGVVLGARLWWPGDAPVRCWAPVASSMAAKQVDITPAEGAGRGVVEETFEHAMVVLTVSEVSDG